MNARFNIFHCSAGRAGTVTLTLKPGQSLTWCHRYGHEEGWSEEGRTWTWDGRKLREDAWTDGTDCDGRLSTGNSSIALIGSLDDQRRPNWHTVDESRRDYAAEAAGY